MARSVSKYPDFLGIGAARAGTTWLSQVLGAHPDIWIPAIKELHYFTRSAKYVGPSQLVDARPLKRLFSREKPYRQYRRVAGKAIASNVIRPSLKRLRWDANYLLRRPGDEWYASLFDEGTGRVTGEITPRYSMLDIADIQALRRLMPEVRLIFIMRDPVERAWSLVKYHVKRNNEQLGRLSADELRKRAFAPVIGLQSDYESILNRWRAVFGPDRLLEIFYDEISARPDALARRIQSFLGVSAIGIESAGNPGRVNGSFGKSMPMELRAELIEYYRPMIERLADEEGGCFATWLDTYGRTPTESEQRCAAAGSDFKNAFYASA